MNIENLLKKGGKSCTKERKQIHLYLENNHIVSSNDLVDFFDGKIGRASVFRTLKLFLELGIVRRVQAADKGENYELNHIDHHHHEHFNCSDCGDCISFESENLCKKIFEEATKIGFNIKEHNIGVFGTCKNCS